MLPIYYFPLLNIYPIDNTFHILPSLSRQPWEAEPCGYSLLVLSAGGYDEDLSSHTPSLAPGEVETNVVLGEEVVTVERALEPRE